MKTKKCITCNIEKSVDMFYKRADAIDGYRNQCKECFNKVDKQNKEAKREYYLQQKKEYYNKNKDHLNEIKKEYYKNNREKMLKINKEYREQHKQEVQFKKNEWQRTHKEYRRQKYKEKVASDPLYKLKIKLRNSIKSRLYSKNIKPNKRTEEILGCTIEQFKEHIEKQFVEGMSWENKGKWHLDHIIPLASAKSEEEVIKLCHYTNFQPLWAIDNLKKGSRIVGENAL